MFLKALKRTDIRDEFRLRAVMFIPRKNAESVLQDSTVVVDVQRTLIISMVTIDDSYDTELCIMERKRVECAIMIKAALADTEGEEE